MARVRCLLAVRAAAGALLSLALAGCRVDVSPYASVLSGTLAWSGKDWESASASFLRGEAGTDDPVVKDYALYGLAATCLAQGEYAATEAYLEGVLESPVDEIRAGAWYQAGTIAHLRGEYAAAVAAFKRSLRVDPSRVDAKVNLELCLRSLKEAKARRAPSAAGVREEAGDGAGIEAMFTLIRKKEQDRWRNQAEDDSESSVADY